jgi:hypothetical protein
VIVDTGSQSASSLTNKVIAALRARDPELAP